MVAQVHPEEGGDLIVAGSTGAQAAADLGAGPLDESALQRGVHVLVILGGHEGTRLDIRTQPLEAIQHRRQ